MGFSVRNWLKIDLRKCWMFSVLRRGLCGLSWSGYINSSKGTVNCHTSSQTSMMLTGKMPSFLQGLESPSNVYTPFLQPSRPLPFLFSLLLSFHPFLLLFCGTKYGTQGLTLQGKHYHGTDVYMWDGWKGRAWLVQPMLKLSQCFTEASSVLCWVCHLSPAPC